INIHAHAHPIEVSYSSVRALIPTLLFPTPNDPAVETTKSVYKSLDGHVHIITKPPLNEKADEEAGAKYDIVIHIGLASGRGYYSIETCAHRDGYVKEDIHHQELEGDTFWRDEYGAPEVLTPSFDFVDVWRRWKQGLPYEDVRPSINAGRYLCEFIFYASMLEFWRRGEGERCMFLHVPSGSSEEEMGRGRRVVLALIAAVVGSEIVKRSRRKGVKGYREEDGMRIMNEGDGC
ncbi:MAG: hypothetical protein Q9217_005861, partial [Psora testacea]